MSSKKATIGKKIAYSTASLAFILSTVATPLTALAEEVSSKAETKVKNVALAPNEEVNIPDAALKTIIQTNLGLIGKPVTQADMLKLTSLDGSNKRIESIEGLQYATNLTHLDLTSNIHISSLEPLKNLNKLLNLGFSGKSDAAFAQITSMTQLKVLSINHIRNVTDYSGLANLVNLTKLDAPLNFTQEDTEVFKNLTSLTQLNMYSLQNKLSIDFVKDLPKLEMFTIGGTRVTSFEPLKNMSALKALSISGYLGIPDLEIISELTNLSSLKLNNAGISNDEVGLISELTNLSSLELENNSLTDVSVLKGLLPHLTKLSLARNQISDLSPFEGLTLPATFYAYGQNIYLQSAALQTPEASTDNMIKDAQNRTVAPTTVANGGIYDSLTNKINWKNLPLMDSNLDYTWKDGNFSGTVSQKYNLIQMNTPTEYKLGDTHVTGTQKNSAFISLKINGEELPLIPTNGEESFQLDTQNKITKTTDVVTVQSYDVNRVVQSSYKVKIAPTTGTIDINDFALGKDKYLEGSYTGDVAKVQLKVGDTTYNGGTVAEGKIKVYAYGKITNETDPVTLTAFDKEGKQLDTKNVTVTTETSQGTITPTDFTLGTSRYLEGTFTGDVAKVKTTVNGTDYAGGTVADGKFKVYAYDKIKNASDIVTITAYDKKGTQLDSKTVHIDAFTGSGTVTPDAYTFGTSRYVTGSYTGDVTKMELEVDGEIFKGGTVADGKINFYAYGKIKANSQTVNILVYDKRGNLLDTKPVVLNK